MSSCDVFSLVQWQILVDAERFGRVVPEVWRHLEVLLLPSTIYCGFAGHQTSNETCDWWSRKHHLGSSGHIFRWMPYMAPSCHRNSKSPALSPRNCWRSAALPGRSGEVVRKLNGNQHVTTTFPEGHFCPWKHWTTWKYLSTLLPLETHPSQTFSGVGLADWHWVLPNLDAGCKSQNPLRPSLRMHLSDHQARAHPCACKMPRAVLSEARKPASIAPGNFGKS